ncbi:MAG: hypothetical protein K9M45_12295, partial [Kiritimatiellales bacterium]|nr:hypothetical protein [Kiritimatiellales bacterium]
MMRRKQSAAAHEQPVEYREESVRREVLVMLVLAVLIAVPLLWAGWKIETQGRSAANIKPYLDITLEVNRRIRSVYAKLKTENIEIKTIDPAAELEKLNLALLAAQDMEKEKNRR